MSNDEATKMLIVMTQLWWKYTIPDGTLQLWKNELRNCDYDIAELALHSLADETNDWPSFAQYRRHYRARTPLPVGGERVLAAPRAPKEAAMRHIAEMRANLRK
jgi:hypothetical protein